MSEYIYRYRSIERALQELKNQTIRFSAPEKLNDPLEDFRYTIWKGDKALWKNLFKNYIISLQNFREEMIHRDEHLFDEDEQSFMDEKKQCFMDEKDINVSITFDNLSDSRKNRVEKIFKDFFDCETVIWFLDKISSRKRVSKEELIIYLDIVHRYCLQLIDHYNDTIDNENKLFRGKNNLIEDHPFFNMELLELMQKENKDLEELHEIEDPLFKAIQHHLYQAKFNNSLDNQESYKQNQRFYFFSFPSNYVNQIQNLMFWPWYTSCFSKKSTNHVMWSHYADEHKGVCLKFKTRKKSHSKGIFLMNTKNYNENKKRTCKRKKKIFFKLHNIDYNSKPRPIDFFKSIGMLPLDSLKSQWYSNDNGSISPLVKNIVKDRKSWRKKYRKPFYDDIRLKMKDWSYEEEVRLIHESDSNEKIVEEDRDFEYNFGDLKEVIFGLNTSEADKRAISKMIKDKCRKVNRKKFKFSQSDYDIETGEIETVQLNKKRFQNQARLHIQSFADTHDLLNNESTNK